MSELLMPYYQLFISGREIDEHRYSMIDTIDFEDTASGSDLLKIVLNDPDLEILSDNIFVEDVKVHFKGGWFRGDIVEFTGYISQIEADFPDSGTPTITINCMDNSYIMNTQKKQRTWENTRVSDVATQIFRENGLTPHVDRTPDKEDSISQNETDIKFLINLADQQIDNYIVYVEGTHGYFVKKPVIANPQKTVSYRQDDGDLLSFQPSINKYSKQVKTTYSEVDQDNNTVYTSTTGNDVPRPVSGETYNPTTSDKSSSSNSSGSWVYINGKWVQK